MFAKLDRCFNSLFAWYSDDILPSPRPPRACSWVNQVGRLTTTYSMGLPADTFQQSDKGDPRFQSPKVYRFKVAPCRETYRFASTQRAAQTVVLVRIRPNPSLTRRGCSHHDARSVRACYGLRLYGGARDASTCLFRNRTREEEPCARKCGKGG